MTPVKPITPTDAAERIRSGALLVDIREPDERVGACIPAARSLPLSAIDSRDLRRIEGQAVIFHCRSGRRTQANADGLAAKAGSGEIFILEGGIDAWRAAGLPVEDGQ
ncbi:MAG: hypothetical protein B7Y86_02635 [Brevundimonas subvibrioides]|uniref:Rhodanese domain-containing protein n=1 Tax=Brevundimonas subvibrioides TaxID=74313 RepID=A0A258HQF7_9CAUL|nr:rhodanese-like domain-containing protein [Brevundimonas subvibrioides]OYX58602.1 MAG: hypothetical protein B7Y86_02635 [Brevundimonas subvibrioides]